MSNMCSETADRRAWMRDLAQAETAALQEAAGPLVAGLAYEWLRPPEIGSVMLRGRAGAVGAPFNLGEMTVTRCTLRLTESGVVGCAYTPGRDKAHARLAALCDALLQQPERSAEVAEVVLAPLRSAAEARRAARARKAAATRVEFFTVARGED